MSAIAGLVRFDRRLVVPGEVGRMIDALAHRGLHRGVLCEGVFGFAHGSSHATPGASRDEQPLRDRSTPFVLVADARIDNVPALASDLGFPGASRPTSSEIILAAYARWGAACVEKLCGDFAFAIWDSRTQSVFCARDPMGVRPLYYVHSPHRFAFASEIKALLTIPDVSRELDAEMVALFVEGESQERDRTLYRDIHRLAAGHSMRIDGRGCVQSRYWRLESVGDVRYARDEEYAEAFRELFAESVSCRMVTEHPIAAALSGGLDSSSVVCMARKLRRERGSAVPLHTFSLVFPGLPAADLRLIDERSFIGAVVSGGDIEPHDVRGDRLTPLSDLDTLVSQLDEPFSAPNLYLHRGMYAAASVHNARVFLDGFDGDSAVSHGLGRLDSLIQSGAWSTFESEVRSFASHRGIAVESILPHHGLPRLAELARAGRMASWVTTARELTTRFGLSRRTLGVDYGIRPLVPARAAEGWRALRGRTRPSLLRPELARGVRERMAKGHRQAPGDASPERISHIAGISQALYQTTLELANQTAACFGVEPRYPFFDRRLIEFCVGLPDEQKFAGGWSRSHLRRAMTGILPAEIQWRSSKGNLSPNFYRAFRLTDKTVIDQLPFQSLAPYLDLSSLEALRQRQSVASPSALDSEALVLFRISVLATWLHERSRGGTQCRPATSRGYVVAEPSAPLAHRAAASAVASTSHQE